MLSLIIPVYNEKNAVRQCLERAVSVLQESGESFEILAVDDGSSDGTSEILEHMQNPSVRVVRHPKNTGYSASIKTGIRHAHGDLLAISDADGTYPIEELPTLVHKLKTDKADMVVGARTKQNVHIPWNRRPAKAVVNAFANYLVQQKIPDLNSGLRVFTPHLAKEFWHLYPQRFSFTMTITLAALTNGYQVEFHPIDYHKRIGSSSMSSGLNGVKNFASFLALVTRIVTYFRPLRFFAPPCLLLIFLGLCMMAYTIWTEHNISDAGMLLFVTGIQLGVLGLLADVMIKHRRAG